LIFHRKRASWIRYRLCSFLPVELEPLPQRLLLPLPLLQPDQQESPWAEERSEPSLVPAWFGLN